MLKDKEIYKNANQDRVLNSAFKEKMKVIYVQVPESMHVQIKKFTSDTKISFWIRNLIKEHLEKQE